MVSIKLKVLKLLSLVILIGFTVSLFSFSSVADERVNEPNNFPIEQGDRDDGLIVTKQMLNWLGYDGILVTNYLGSYSSNQVKQFQADHSLTANGIVNQQTYQTLKDEFKSTFQVGSRHSGITQFKEKLKSIGFAPGLYVTNFYGDYNAEKVEEFQNYYNLNVTGNITLPTLNKLEEVYNSPYQYGKTYSETSTIKEKLNRLDFGQIIVTDYFGSFTEQKVKEFQNQYNLKANGIIDSQTEQKINELNTHPIQKGNRHDKIPNMKYMLNWLNYDGILITNYLGDYTEKMLKQFQEDNNIPAHGIYDSITESELEEEFRSAYQVGGSNPKVKEVKRILNNVGFGGILVTDYFGNYTQEQVSNFQNYYGIKATGTINIPTLKKLIELRDTSFQKGSTHSETSTYKKMLNRLGFGKIIVTDYFGSFTETQVERFQHEYGLAVSGMLDQPTRDLLKEIYNTPYQQGNSDSFIAEIKLMLNSIDGYGGIIVSEYFGNFTEQRVKEFQSDQGLPSHGIVDDRTLAVLEKEADIVSMVNYDVNFSRAVNIQMTQGTPKYDGAGQVMADEANVSYYMNPSNFSEGNASYMQFLRLDHSTNVEASEINQFLNGAGVLEGQGQAFVKASREQQVNELYLVAHTLHETGNGSSTLARGIGVDNSGNVIRENGNIVRDEDHEDVDHIVYNMYGYGAHDNNPINGGAKYAFDQGWFTPSEAIIGGGSNIVSNYISQGQNTLYKMKWDPDYMETNNARGKQYATHIKWANVQASNLYSMYNALSKGMDHYALSYEVPKFASQPGPDGSVPPPPDSDEDNPEDHLEQSFPSGVVGEVAVSSGTLNFREGPSTSYDVIDGISKGTVVDVLGDNGGQWLMINYNGDKGWVHRDYLDVLNLYVVDSSNGITYRESPAGSKAGTIANNRFVVLNLDSSHNIVSKNATLSGTNYTWYRIYRNGNSYWTANNWLEPIE